MTSVQCAHCGLPAKVRRNSDPNEDSFCCIGCHLAHQLSGKALEGQPDRLLGRLILSSVLAMGVMVFTLSLWGDYLAEEAAKEEAAGALRGLFRLGALGLSAPVLLLLGAPLLESITATRRLLSADSLILLGACAAFGLSAWNTWTGRGQVYFETTTAVLVLVTLGKWLDARARDRASSALGNLAEQSIAAVSRVTADGEVQVSPDALRVGDPFRLRPGEEAPVDAVVVEGQCFVNTSVLTGEEEPRALGPGATMLAGYSLIDGSLLLRVTAVQGSRVRDEIERRLAEAVASRPRHIEIADRIAAALLPIVVTLAIATAAWHGYHSGAEKALLSALAVVLVSCPCALGIATPYVYWIALGEAWRHGALVRSSEVLEKLARVRRVFFDKTGTLTTGAMQIQGVRVHDANWSEDQARSAAAALERGSEHPIGRALHAAWNQALPAVEDFEALPGIGVRGSIGGRELKLSRSAHTAGNCSVVALHAGSKLIAEFDLVGEIRPDAAQAMRELRQQSFAPIMLTGDGRGAAQAVASELEIDFRAELMPADKVAAIVAARRQGTLFVGDGLNDSAAMGAADVAVSMPSSAQPSIHASGIALVRGELCALPWLIQLSQRAERMARANLVWAFAYNSLGLWLAASGRLTPIFAASAMVVSSALVVIRSGRLRSPDGGPQKIHNTAAHSTHFGPAHPAAESGSLPVSG